MKVVEVVAGGGGTRARSWMAVVVGCVNCPSPH